MDTAETGDSCAHTARCAVLVTPQDKAPALPLALDLVILLPHEAWLYCDHCSFRSALPGYSQYLSQGMPLSPHPLSSLSIRFLRDGPPPLSQWPCVGVFPASPAQLLLHSPPGGRAPATRRPAPRSAPTTPEVESSRLSYSLEDSQRLETVKTFLKS